MRTLKFGNAQTYRAIEKTHAILFDRWVIHKEKIPYALTNFFCPYISVIDIDRELEKVDIESDYLLESAFKDLVKKLSITIFKLSSGIDFEIYDRLRMKIREVCEKNNKIAEFNQATEKLERETETWPGFVSYLVAQRVFSGFLKEIDCSPHNASQEVAISNFEDLLFLKPVSFENYPKKKLNLDGYAISLLDYLKQKLPYRANRNWVMLYRYPYNLETKSQLALPDGPAGIGDGFSEHALVLSVGESVGDKIKEGYKVLIHPHHGIRFISVCGEVPFYLIQKDAICSVYEKNDLSSPIPDHIVLSLDEPPTKKQNEQKLIGVQHATHQN